MGKFILFQLITVTYLAHSVAFAVQPQAANANTVAVFNANASSAIATSPAPSLPVTTTTPRTVLPVISSAPISNASNDKEAQDKDKDKDKAKNYALALKMAMDKDKLEANNFFNYEVTSNNIINIHNFSNLSKISKGIPLQSRGLNLSFKSVTPLLIGMSEKYSQIKNYHNISLISYKLGAEAIATLKDCNDQALSAIQNGNEFTIEALGMKQHQVLLSHREYLIKYQIQNFLKRIMEKDKFIKEGRGWKNFSQKYDDDNDEVRRSIYINLDSYKVNCRTK